MTKFSRTLYSAEHIKNSIYSNIWQEITICGMKKRMHYGFTIVHLNNLVRSLISQSNLLTHSDFIVKVNSRGNELGRDGELYKSYSQFSIEKQRGVSAKVVSPLIEVLAEHTRTPLIKIVALILKEKAKLYGIDKGAEYVVSLIRRLDEGKLELSYLLQYGAGFKEARKKIEGTVESLGVRTASKINDCTSQSTSLMQRANDFIGFWAYYLPNKGLNRELYGGFVIAGTGTHLAISGESFTIQNGELSTRSTWLSISEANPSMNGELKFLYRCTNTGRLGGPSQWDSFMRLNISGEMLNGVIEDVEREGTSLGPIQALRTPFKIYRDAAQDALNRRDEFTISL